MLFEAGIILGAHSEPVAYPGRSGSSHVHWPYLQLERTVNDYITYWVLVRCARCLLVTLLMDVDTQCFVVCFILYVFIDRVKCIFSTYYGSC